MEPLRLTWILSTPLVSSAYPIHLDALLAYAVTESTLQSCQGGYWGDLRPDTKVRSLADELPLERAIDTTDPGRWCWKASALQGKTLAHATRIWSRKTDPYDFAEWVDRGAIEGRWKKPFAPFAYKVDLQRGGMKNHFQFVPVRSVRTLVAYCIGDADRILELLSPESGLVTSIGSRGRSGFGRILDFQVTPDLHAETLWQNRILPWKTEGSIEIQAAHQPPYWTPENRFERSFAPIDLFS